MESLKSQIFLLRSEGKSYDSISKQLGCSKSTISYHLNDDQKTKMSVRRRKYREKAGFILSRKIDFFTRERESRGHHKNSLGRITKILNNKICNFVREGDTMSRSFSVDDLLKRVGDNPICYLTGEKIDLSKSSTYQLDHIVPRTLGGDNSLENLGLCISKANMAKTDMPLEEFFSLCRRILENNGYAVSKKEST